MVVTSQQGLARAATRSGASAERGDVSRSRAHTGHGHVARATAHSRHATRIAHIARARAQSGHGRIARAKASAKRAKISAKRGKAFAKHTKVSAKRGKVSAKHGNRSTGTGAHAKLGSIAADWALRQLGKPYRWAAAGPNSFDCSGLTMRAWGQAGVQLEHFTGTQWTSGPHIPLNQLRRGDLVFYASNTAKPSTIQHVGLYIGGGKMVDAPHDGAVVRIETINEPGLIGATRPA